MLRPSAATTSAFRVKALYLYLRDRRGPAEAADFAERLGGALVISDETRVLSQGIWLRALADFERAVGVRALDELAPYLVHPEALGAWARVLRGATVPADVLGALVDPDRVPGDPVWESWHRQGSDWIGTALLGAIENGEDRLRLKACMKAEAVAAISLLGLQARASSAQNGERLEIRLRIDSGQSSPAIALAWGLLPALAFFGAAASSPWGPSLGSKGVLAGAILFWTVGVLGGVLFERDRQRQRESVAQRFRILALEREASVRQQRPHQVARPHEEPVIAGQYRVGKQLGVGGSGAVWSAIRLTDGAEVALKLIRTALTHDVRATDRLRREAEALGLSWHPNVVEVLDHGVLPSGVAFLVMERLVGESIAERLDRDGPLPATLVRELAIELADALVAIHSAGIVHRDIKPGNLFLHDPSGNGPRLKLLDFGVARVSWAETRLTRSGIRIGTAGYAAPEQEEGADVDGRADLYAVGVTLRECLSGVPPVIPGRPHDVPLRTRTIPSAFVPILDLLCQVNPADRIGSARELRDRLQLLPEVFPSASEGPAATSA